MAWPTPSQLPTAGKIEVRVFPYGDIFSWGREVGGGGAMPRNSSAVAAVAPLLNPKKLRNWDFGFYNTFFVFMGVGSHGPFWKEKTFFSRFISPWIATLKKLDRVILTFRCASDGNGPGIHWYYPWRERWILKMEKSGFWIL